MAFCKYVVLAILLVGVMECHAGYKHKMKRSPKAGGESPQSPDAKKKETWKPVSEPQEFTVMVDDNINKADQFRHETWKPGGVVEGEYAAPARDGKWLKVNYRADKDGFHIRSQQEVTEAELKQPSGGAAADHQAKVEQNINGKDVQYTVKEEDLKKAKAKQDSQHGGL